MKLLIDKGLVEGNIYSYSIESTQALCDNRSCRTVARSAEGLVGCHDMDELGTAVTLDSG